MVIYPSFLVNGAHMGMLLPSHLIVTLSYFKFIQPLSRNHHLIPRRIDHLLQTRMPCVLLRTISCRIRESVFLSTIPKIQGCTNQQGYSFGCGLRRVTIGNSWVRLVGESLSWLLHYQIILRGHTWCLLKRLWMQASPM